MKPLLAALAAAPLALLAPSQAAAAALVLGLFFPVPDAETTYASAPALLGGQPGWVEQGLRTEQINGDGGVADIWTLSGLSPTDGSAWYPDGGDDGYTRLTRTLGQNFGSVSLFAGIGWLDDEGPSLTAYELLDDGVVVLSGTLAAPFTGAVFGFTGGDFDEIRLRAYRGPLPNFDSCPPVEGIRCNTLWIDSVWLLDDPMTEVPVPPVGALAALGLGLLARQRRPQRWQAKLAADSMSPPWKRATVG